MITGFYGEQKGAPTEGITLRSWRLKRDGLISQDEVRAIRKILQEHLYFEPIVKEMVKMLSQERFDALYGKYAEGRNKLFTDDAVMTIATADALMKKADGSTKSWDRLFTDAYHSWGKKYPEAGYGKEFRKWLASKDPSPYGSWGNGSAMRIAPVAYFATSIEEVRRLAKESCDVTHGHPEAVRAGQAVAEAIFMGRTGSNKDQIRERIVEQYEYDLGRTIAQIRPTYKFYSEAADSVPESIIAFLESHDGISAVEGALSLGGDTDTQAMIAGSIADGLYGYAAIPLHVTEAVYNGLPQDMLDVLVTFQEKYILNQ